MADATISRIERGRISPSMALLARLAQALDVDPAELVRGVPGKPRRQRAPEARLMALVRSMDDAQVDDIAKAIKLLIAVGKRS